MKKAPLKSYITAQSPSKKKNKQSSSEQKQKPAAVVGTGTVHVNMVGKLTKVSQQDGTAAETIE